MPTTLSTGTVLSNDSASRFNYHYSPKVVRAFTTDSTAGSTTLFAVFPSHPHALARVTMHAKELAANTTLTVQLLTGPTSTSVDQHVRTSTGGVSGVDFATTDAETRVFVGLDHYTRVQLNSAGGAAASAGVYIDAELV